MATYTYKCYTCERCEEHVHGMNETPTYFCSNCLKPLSRIITTTKDQLVKDFTHSTYYDTLNRPRGGNSFKGKSFRPPSKTFTGND